MKPTVHWAVSTCGGIGIGGGRRFFLKSAQKLMDSWVKPLEVNMCHLCPWYSRQWEHGLGVRAKWASSGMGCHQAGSSSRTSTRLLINLLCRGRGVCSSYGQQGCARRKKSVVGWAPCPCPQIIPPGEAFVLPWDGSEQQAGSRRASYCLWGPLKGRQREPREGGWRQS